jgi:putative DNA methylase
LFIFFCFLVVGRVVRATPESYTNAVATYLAFVVDKGTNLWSTITSWMNDRGAFRETFARQAIPMVWDFAEANPFSESGGNISMFAERVANVIEFLPGFPFGLVQQQDATQISNKNFLFSTDPPYYDNIVYADLADFFYVWLRYILSDYYNDLFVTLLVPKTQELVATPYRFNGDRQLAERFFVDGLRNVFSKMSRFAIPNYPTTIYYAFKQSESEDDQEGSAFSDMRYSTGWETMLQSLLLSEFEITGTWPIRTESPGRSVARGTNALASSIVLVCRPRPEDAPTLTRREFLAALKRELPPALRELQKGNIAPVDLAQAAIGPGMAIFSRYRAVLEADGFPMSVRAALTLINQALDEFLAEQEGEYDADTRWALAWFEQYGHEQGPYGVAETLSKAKNSSVEGLAQAGFLEARAGKVRLLRREELAEDWDPAQDKRLTAWEAAQYLIRTLDREGENGAGALLAILGTIGETARDLAYRLYTICERKGWAQDALIYNMLVVAWSRIKEQAKASPTNLQGRLLV